MGDQERPEQQKESSIMSQKPTLQHSVTKHRHPKKTHLRPDGSSNGVGGKRTETRQVIALSNKHGRRSGYIRLRHIRRATKTETGEVITLGNNQITLTNTTPDPEMWIVDARGAHMDVANHPITYDQLTIGSTVKVTAHTENWKQLQGVFVPLDGGKRTEGAETGEVIALTSNQITLTNTTPDPEMWTVDVSDGSATIVDPNSNSPITYNQLTIGSTVKVTANVEDWKQLA
jgi:hypothetical protein